LSSAQYEERTLGSLAVRLVRFGDSKRPLTGGIVLAHGYGAGGDDLVPFAEELASRNPALPDNFVYIFPAAPNSLEHLGFYNGRAWWQLDLDRLEKRLRIDGVQALSTETPPGLVESRNAFLGMLAAVETELKFSLF
jgi:phospholipase/carboxylesterase